MQSIYCKNKVIENIRIDRNIFRLTVEGEFSVKPGQFFMLRAWTNEPLLSRPISICDIGENSIVFLYEIHAN